MKKNIFYIFHQKWANRIQFQPAQKISVGLGFAYKSFGLDLGVAVYRQGILPDQTTKGFNFIGALYRGRNIIEITLQVNNGFAESADSAGKKIDITRNDIDAFNFGVNYNYLFNYRKCSMNAAFSGTQIQKKSAGSPLLGVFFSNMNVISGDSLISPRFSSLLSPAEIGTQVNVFCFGFTGGYAYTLVLPHRFYIAAYITPGITFSLSQSPRDSFNLVNTITNISPKLDSHAALGYAGKSFYSFATFGFDINTNILGNKNLLLYAPEKIKLAFGLRI